MKFKYHINYNHGTIIEREYAKEINVSIDFLQKKWSEASYGSQSSENEWVRFAGMITAATLLPWLCIPFIMSIQPSAPSLTTLFSLFVFIGGTAHVGASSFFLYTPEFRDHRTQRAKTYWIGPLALTFFLATGFTWGPDSFQKNAILIYFIWQTWHYQRQNFGLLSMAGISTQTGPVTKWERVALDVGVLAGIGGLFFKMNIAQGTLLEPFAQGLYTAGSLLICVNPILVVYVFIKNPHFLEKPTRPFFFLLGAFFYLPTFLFKSPEASILSYALAHGWQYLVFMTYVAQRKPQHQRQNMKLFLYCCFGGGIILSLLGDQSLWGSWGPGVFGAYLGLIIWHFITDADIWRLREPFQRQYMNAAFPFLNPKANKAAP
ncbi:MAG: hypothetical protein AB8C84_06100 [Oligoflexales bacterium]